MITLDLADAMASKVGITREQGLAAIKAMTDAIAVALKEGDTVALRGFGTLKLMTQTSTAQVERPGHDQPVTITRKHVAFKPGVLFAHIEPKG